MTKNQKARLASKIFTFIIAFSLLMVCLPYVAVALAIYFAVEIARRI